MISIYPSFMKVGTIVHHLHLQEIYKSIVESIVDTVYDNAEIIILQFFEKSVPIGLTFYIIFIRCLSGSQCQNNSSELTEFVNQIWLRYFSIVFRWQVVPNAIIDFVISCNQSRGQNPPPLILKWSGPQCKSALHRVTSATCNNLHLVFFSMHSLGIPEWHCLCHSCLDCGLCS